jgi:hypothetical protein
MASPGATLVSNNPIYSERQLSAPFNDLSGIGGIAIAG